jgi:hypothetical protein
MSGDHAHDDVGLEVDGRRPAVEWVTSLPAGSLTHLERLVLMVLACDSYDGETSAPGRDNLRTWCGLSNNQQIERPLKALVEKGLIVPERRSRRERVTYRLASARQATPVASVSEAPGVASFAEAARRRESPW